ncbi:thiamine pyrophosphate-dependent dehydrogenase E1 component subunit alpha [Acidiferrimicrobium sp. IK]|uniref:thiamine pyrophosphate-dependent dehydrogenase E1 component subunit alpha n=1 Tax=Acidiferrimicrobium sp. IK TaxID=2871700 RepID=UPI0021CB7EB5|nr:thiamine pyrophosphate-dependent dehydrogenase E1 component subunit alpha [Acidiferrimicrobium sp. IK]MCU4184965.1 thiamine pyrophosphate-dependent dehydrogenase E1 component subunit alpha [Acidiferrimicrobium sp. IK]
MPDLLNPPPGAEPDRGGQVTRGPATPESLTVMRSLLRWMVLSRAVEDRLRTMYQQSRLRGRLISGRGQEATAVGAAYALGALDVVAPVHRDLGVHLVRGTPVLDVVRHYLGRAAGPSGGRDGDIHMGEWHRGVFPMVSHLPDSWPVMAGVGLAFKLRGESRVAMALCGDGATSVGTWHEAVNFAAVFETPTVFVVENNQYAYSTPTSRQYRVEHLAERASAYGIPGVRVDGNDAVAVYRACLAAVESARSGGGPTLIETETFRVDGHAIHDDARYVPEELRLAWQARDPIDRLAEAFCRHGGTAAEVQTMKREAAAEVRAAVAQAETEPLPDPVTLTDGVYAPALEQHAQTQR